MKNKSQFRDRIWCDGSWGNPGGTGGIQEATQVGQVGIQEATQVAHQVIQEKTTPPPCLSIYEYWIFNSKKVVSKSSAIGTPPM